jgi:hypothetical protein
MKKNANCFVQLFSKVYSNSILFVSHVISFLCNFWLKLHFRVLLSNISWTCICIVNNEIWIVVMTIKLDEDNKNYHGMTFSCILRLFFITYSWQFHQALFDMNQVPIFAVPINSFLFLSSNCNRVWQVCMILVWSQYQVKTYASDETLPIINKPKHPKKKKRENTRNKMKGPTSKKTKEPPKRANDKGNMKLINCIDTVTCK